MPVPTNPPRPRPKQRFELYFPAGRNGTAFLSTQLANGSEASVELDARIARIAVVLGKARDQDGALEPSGARGWRTRRQVADAIERLTDWPISLGAVTAYASQLATSVAGAMRAVMGQARPTILFIERRRGLGLRLAEDVELEIRDGTDRD